MTDIQILETLEYQRFMVAGIAVMVFVIALVAGILLVSYFKLK
jgi:uncharacterized protein involved in exopolysaccharide biosynthesis